MFKNFSQQLGTNLTSLKDEISKQIQEKREDFNELYENSTQQTTSNMILPEEYTTLPKEVQGKMLKFMKYEEKYPQLLNAYKKFRQDTIDLSNVNDTLERKINEQEQCLNAVRDYYVFDGYEDLGDFLAKWTERETLIKQELTFKNKEITELKNTISLLEKKAASKGEPETSAEFKTDTEAIANSNEDVVEEEESEDAGNIKAEGNAACAQSSPEVLSETKDDAIMDIEVTKEAQYKAEEKSNSQAPENEKIKAIESQQQTASLSSDLKPRSSIQWQIKYNSLDRDYKQLQKDYFEVKDTLNIKDEEINNTKDMLKEIGNQLVEMKDKQKQTSSTKTVEEVKYKALETSNKQMQARNVSLSLETQKLKTESSEKENKVKNLELDIKQLAMKNGRLTTKLDELISEKQQFITNLDRINAKLELKIKENGQLEERVAILKEKSLQTENIKTTSTDIVESLTRQCNELNSKLKEISNLKNNVEQELSQTNDTVFKQKRDLQVMNEKILSYEIEVKKLKQVNNQLALRVEDITKEQESFDNERFQNLQNVVFSKTAENKELEEKVKELEVEIAQLQKQIQLLGVTNLNREMLPVSSDDTDVLDQTIKNLKAELQSKNKSLNNMELTLQSLRKLNKDLNFKIDKLNKIYQQQRIASNSGLRNSSNPSEPSKEEEDVKAKISYIKNVLIGFIEHKDQRQQLLPVISMLLQFTPQDQQKFLTCLK